jgi:hypothetical protein
VPQDKKDKNSTKKLIDGFTDHINILLENESYASLAEKAGLDKTQIQSIMDRLIWI